VLLELVDSSSASSSETDGIHSKESRLKNESVGGPRSMEKHRKVKPYPPSDGVDY